MATISSDWKSKKSKSSAGGIMRGMCNGSEEPQRAEIMTDHGKMASSFLCEQPKFIEY